MAESRQKPLN